MRRQETRKRRVIFTIATTCICVCDNDTGEAGESWLLQEKTTTAQNKGKIVTTMIRMTTMVTTMQEKQKERTFEWRNDDIIGWCHPTSDWVEYSYFFTWNQSWTEDKTSYDDSREWQQWQHLQLRLSYGGGTIYDSNSSNNSQPLQQILQHQQSLMNSTRTPHHCSPLSLQHLALWTWSPQYQMVVPATCTCCTYHKHDYLNLLSLMEHSCIRSFHELTGKLETPSASAIKTS